MQLKKSQEKLVQIDKKFLGRQMSIYLREIILKQAKF